MYQYFEAEPNNLSWLKSAGQWNSKAVYPDYYNWLLQEKNNPSTLPADTANVEITGSLTNNNGVLSGFSESNYAEISQTPSNIESLEIVFKFTTGDDITTRQIIHGNTTRNMASPQLTFAPNEEDSADGILEDESFDTGDIIAQKAYHIHSKATMGTLFNELNVLGIELLLQVLQAYENQPLPRIKQPVGDFISGRGLDERELFINYNKTAEEIERFVRALNPFILASTTFRGNMMKIMKVEVASDAFCVPHPAGTVAKIEDDKFFIATAKGLVVPTVMQFGSFFMGDSKDFIRIVNPKIGEEFKG